MSNNLHTDNFVHQLPPRVITNGCFILLLSSEFGIFVNPIFGIKNRNRMNKYLCCFLLILSVNIGVAQVVLSADGPGNTYSLITSVLAPGHNPIETPDCSHNAFGDHIDEVYDEDLGAHVFRFYMHVTPDDDRCINFDRQRNEIKSYNQSPDNLLGVLGENVEYRWKFKLDEGFQSSPKFTHIHQLKAVGGSEASMPLLTLTTRLGSPDKLQLRYAETLSQIGWAETDLTPFKGVWCEATERVTYGDWGEGVYSLIIKKVSDNTVLFTYTNNSTRMWKTDADFIRPKWGIYRSLEFSENLRDEEVLFADFSVEEFTVLPVQTEDTDDKADLRISPNPTSGIVSIIGMEENAILDIYDNEGRKIKSGLNISEPVDMIFFPEGTYFFVFKLEGQTYTRCVLKQ